jgi:predicted nucleic acid-binding protein
MIVIIDTNILFSACIAKEKQSRISEILFSPVSSLEHITCSYARTELTIHHEKLLKASKLSADELAEYLHGIFKRVQIFEEEIIEKPLWQEADRLTRGVDGKDIAFVALALQTDGLLWTGDKRLAGHLKTMGFDRVVNTAELAALLNIE